jgi:hypothetical protein
MARRKITEPDDQSPDAVDAAELPDLTDQQMAFVQGILAGKSGADAYRAAYQCDRMSQRTIHAEASRLRNNRHVAAWLAAGRKAHLGKAGITLDEHIKRLDELIQIALDSGNVGAAVQAEQLIGKALGHYVERYADVTADPVKTLAEIAETSPELAAALARQHGIDWPGTKH